MKHIQVYENFNPLNEDGYGRDYFVKKKEGKTYNYYFKITREDGDGDNYCFVVGIGKLSRSLSIEGPENSYGVISVQPMKESVMDDFLVNDSDYKSRDDEEFGLTRSELMRFYDLVGECIKDYLKNNPKVTNLYDEMALNIDLDFEEYKGIIKSLLSGWSYDKWTIQDGSSERTLIYTKRDHE